MIRKQISIFVENEPGVLARVARALADGSVNIRAVSVSDNSDDAVLRIVVDDEPRALDILEASGALAVSRDIIEVALPHRPGALAEVAAVLAEKGFNIAYLYGSAPRAGEPANLYVRVSGDATAADVAIEAHLRARA